MPDQTAQRKGQPELVACHHYGGFSIEELEVVLIQQIPSTRPGCQRISPNSCAKQGKEQLFGNFSQTWDFSITLPSRPEVLFYPSPRE